MNNFDSVWGVVYDTFTQWVDELQERDSGFEFLQITKATIKLSKCAQLLASSYFEHELIKGKRSIVNVQNHYDNKCFLWSILAKLYPPTSTAHTARLSNYQRYENSLDMSGIEYPVKIKDIPNLKNKTDILYMFMVLRTTRI